MASFAAKLHMSDLKVRVRGVGVTSWGTASLAHLNYLAQSDDPNIFCS